MTIITVPAICANTCCLFKFPSPSIALHPFILSKAKQLIGLS